MTDDERVRHFYASMTDDQRCNWYNHIISPPWGWFKTIHYELGILRKYDDVSQAEIDDIVPFFFGLTVMLWTVLSRGINEQFVEDFLQGKLRIYY